MSIIEINNFSHNYGDKLLFDEATFILNPHEKIGLTGVNGAGKSTLIKAINRYLIFLFIISSDFP